jgi:RNA polymerase sigma-70 factor (ECF subfamily)
MLTVHVDKALARKILGGDETAFRELFDRFFPRLYRFAVVRLDGDREVARDIVQQTFCKAIERLDTYRGEAALYTWFCQICRNTLIDHFRARSKERQRVVLIEDHQDVRAILEALSAPATDEPEMESWRRDVRRLVQATLDHLPARYGDVLEWKYVDGLTVKEIATRLGLGPKAAESLLTRARSAFREVMMTMSSVSDALQRPGHT